MTSRIYRIIEKAKNPMIIFLLVMAVLVSLYIRVILPYDNVFLDNGLISISEDDGVYQMRIVEWIVHNFPDFLWFDAYTLFPHGQSPPWAPLFTYSIAMIALIAGMGSPSLNTIYTIGAYYPAVLGTLVILPVYYIAKDVFGDKRIGVLSAFIIAVIPGQFLSRSLLGFTDHHVAETLLSSILMFFLILSVKAAGEKTFTFSDIRNRNWNALTPTIYYFILASLFMSLYELIWSGALLFAFIIGIYITVQHIINHMSNRRSDYLGILGMMIFLLPLIVVVVIPDFLSGGKSLYYVGLITGMIFFLLLSALSIYINKKGYEKYYYPLSLMVVAVIGLALLSIILPSAYETMMSSLTFFNRSGGGLTIAEAMPFFRDSGGSFSFNPFISNFGINGVIAFAGLILLIYENLRKERQEKTVFIVWTLMMLWALIQQNRFAYYYAVNVALLSAYFGVVVADKILEYGDWDELLGRKNTKRAGTKSKNFKKHQKNPAHEQQNEPIFDFSKLKLSHIISLLLALAIVGYLVYPLVGPAENMGKYGRGMKSYWHESLTWMRYNTPEPGVDFYGEYQKPPLGQDYPYPDSAYGVMSWWDYGHVITAWAHRIPNANPFQAGIGGGTAHAPGASTFLSAQSEEEANAVLDALGINGKPGARYVITDDYITFAAFGAVLEWAYIPYDGFYAQVRTNEGPRVVPYTKRYEAMMMRLHLFDGNGLKTYRLLHESVPSPTGDSAVNMGEAGFKDVYNKLYGGNLTVEYTGHVKIFEHVKGARITGKAPVNSTVSISLNIKTNRGRSYTYSQNTVSNGEYELIVPYSTEGPIPGETNFDTVPTGKYRISAGNTSRDISVDERMVLDGGTVKVDLV